MAVPGHLLAEVAHLFSLLGDATRLRLLSTLHDAGELPVGELAGRAGVSVANASQHLNRLAVAGLVSRRRAGRSVHYAIADPRLEEICDAVCAGVRERAEALAG